LWLRGLEGIIQHHSLSISQQCILRQWHLILTPSILEQGCVQIEKQLWRIHYLYCCQLLDCTRKYFQKKSILNKRRFIQNPFLENNLYVTLLTFKQPFVAKSYPPRTIFSCLCLKKILIWFNASQNSTYLIRKTLSQRFQTIFKHILRTWEKVNIKNKIGNVNWKALPKMIGSHSL